jgi:hypothetical protein
LNEVEPSFRAISSKNEQKFKFNDAGEAFDKLKLEAVSPVARVTRFGDFFFN